LKVRAFGIPAKTEVGYKRKQQADKLKCYDRDERSVYPMTLFALALVLAAAVFHATWNLLAKRVGDGGAVFVWLFGLCSFVIYAPLAVVVVLVSSPHLGPVQFLFMSGSGVLHLGYFVLLQRGYAVGDLSLVYPLARGTGPLLATAAAIVLFGERPSLLVYVGIALITAGVFVLTSESGSLRSGLGAGVIYGLLTGVFIAVYTIWDKQAVSALSIPPLLQSWATILVTTLLLTPVAMSRRKEARALWRAHKPEVIGVAILSPLSYILVLMALVFTPVSYVAPAREISILIGAAMGARLLSEGDSTRRLIAAGAMVIGVIALALG
jgi:drug/metabolite transporter (DMT)-like permease